MPLLHQDNSRGGGGGGSRENRRSLAEIIGLDSSGFGEAATPKTTRSNDREHWQWEFPSSPEAAQTPRGLVPSACFPPRHPTAFASFTESGRPASGSWEGFQEGITEIVASLEALAMPPVNSAQQMSLDSDRTDGAQAGWGSDSVRTRRHYVRHVARRASFSGVVSSHPSNGFNKETSWSGTLPPRCADPNSSFSPKLFLGGLPWDLCDSALMYALKNFHPVSVEWPGRGSATRGYAYVTLESERCVRALLAAARRDGPDWYYRIATRNQMRTKEVQVIPWAVSDSNWVCGGSIPPGGPGGQGSSSAGSGASLRLEPGRTVFVGGLHGMLSAPALARIMADLFAGVVYAGIDTDKNKYPIGSGRVTFNNVHSYVQAIAAAYVEIRTDKFTKKVQILPYLEDTMCSVCEACLGPYFCRDPDCFEYFCRSCWVSRHSTSNHQPLMRNSKTGNVPQLGNISGHSSGNGSSSGSGNGNGSVSGNGNGSGVNGNGIDGNGSGHSNRSFADVFNGATNAMPTVTTEGASSAGAAGASGAVEAAGAAEAESGVVGEGAPWW